MNNISLKKQALLRAIYFFPVGILIGYIITIISSFIYGNGHYIPCSPNFIKMIGNEINAIILQSILCGIIGSSFGSFSIIFDIEKWSLLKQTIVYFIITLIIMMYISYFAHWIEHSLKGILMQFISFTIFFIIFWTIQFLIYKNNINKINKNIEIHKSKSNFKI